MRFDIRGAAFAVQCPDLVTGDSGGANPTPCTNHPAHSSPRGSREQSPRETLLTSGLMSLTSRSGAALSSGRPHVSLPGGAGPNVASSCPTRQGLWLSLDSSHLPLRCPHVGLQPRSRQSGCGILRQLSFWQVRGSSFPPHLLAIHHGGVPSAMTPEAASPNWQGTVRLSPVSGLLNYR